MRSGRPTSTPRGCASTASSASFARFSEGFDPAAALRTVRKFDVDPTRRIDQLSTGQRTAYRLAVALATDVPYLLLDEPVLGLDANARELFYRLLLEELPGEAAHGDRGHAPHRGSGEPRGAGDRHRSRQVALAGFGRRLRASGHSVTGRAKDVDAYCGGRDVLGTDEFGGLKVAYVRGALDADAAGDRLATAPMSLQKLVREADGEERVMTKLQGGAGVRDEEDGVQPRPVRRGRGRIRRGGRSDRASPPEAIREWPSAACTRGPSCSSGSRRSSPSTAIGRSSCKTA